MTAALLDRLLLTTTERASEVSTVLQTLCTMSASDFTMNYEGKIAFSDSFIRVCDKDEGTAATASVALELLNAYSKEHIVTVLPTKHAGREEATGYRKEDADDAEDEDDMMNCSESSAARASAETQGLIMHRMVHRGPQLPGYMYMSQTANILQNIDGVIVVEELRTLHVWQGERGGNAGSHCQTDMAPISLNVCCANIPVFSVVADISVKVDGQTHQCRLLAKEEAEEEHSDLVADGEAAGVSSTAFSVAGGVAVTLLIEGLLLKSAGHCAITVRTEFVVLQNLLLSTLDGCCPKCLKEELVLRKTEGTTVCYCTMCQQKNAPLQHWGCPVCDNVAVCEECVLQQHLALPASDCSVTCPAQHRAAPFKTPRARFTCDVCTKQNIAIQSTMTGCRLCNWDACENCCTHSTCGVIASPRKIPLPLQKIKQEGGMREQRKGGPRERAAREMRLCGQWPLLTLCITGDVFADHHGLAGTKENVESSHVIFMIDSSRSMGGAPTEILQMVLAFFVSSVTMDSEKTVFTTVILWGDETPVVLWSMMPVTAATWEQIEQFPRPIMKCTRLAPALDTATSILHTVFENAAHDDVCNRIVVLTDGNVDDMAITLQKLEVLPAPMDCIGLGPHANEKQLLDLTSGRDGQFLMVPELRATSFDKLYELFYNCVTASAKITVSTTDGRYSAVGTLRASHGLRKQTSYVPLLMRMLSDVAVLPQTATTTPPPCGSFVATCTPLPAWNVELRLEPTTPRDAKWLCMGAALRMTETATESELTVGSLLQEVGAMMPAQSRSSSALCAFQLRLPQQAGALAQGPLQWATEQIVCSGVTNTLNHCAHRVLLRIASEGQHVASWLCETMKNILANGGDSAEENTQDATVVGWRGDNGKGEEPRRVGREGSVVTRSRGAVTMKSAPRDAFDVTQGGGLEKTMAAGRNGSGGYRHQQQQPDAPQGYWTKAGRCNTHVSMAIKLLSLQRTCTNLRVDYHTFDASKELEECVKHFFVHVLQLHGESYQLKKVVTYLTHLTQEEGGPTDRFLILAVLLPLIARALRDRNCGVRESAMVTTLILQLSHLCDIELYNQIQRALVSFVDVFTIDAMDCK